jgi:hypothetical protein
MIPRARHGQVHRASLLTDIDALNLAPMQSAPRAPGQPPPVKIYNAVYSSVQVRVGAYSLQSRLLVASRPGLRMHGPRNRCHAATRRFLCQCNPNP